MTRSLLLSFSSPVSPQREQDFNQWYEDVHIPEVRTLLDGVSEVTRFRQVDAPQSAGRYVALWEIKTDDVKATKAAFDAQAQAFAWSGSDAMDMTVSTPALVWCESI